MSGHRRRRVASVLVVAAALGASACGIAPDDRAALEPDGAIPFDLLGTAPPTVEPDASVVGSATRICLVAGQQRVLVVDRTLEPGYDPADLVDALVAGPTAAERTYGLTSALADPDTVRSVGDEGGVATVDLDPSFAEVPTADQLDVVAQIVCTLTGQPGIGQVRFTVDGRPVEVPRGDGSATSEPVTRADFRTLIIDEGG